MRRIATRALALGAFVVAAAAGAYAVMAAVDRSPFRGDVAATTTTTARFGAAQVVRSPGADGGVCFTVSRGGVQLRRTCVEDVGAGEIAYALARRRSGQLVVAGIVGPDVARVTVWLRPRGTFPPRIVDGAFYAAVPAGKTVKAVRGVPEG
ncbi:MAG TPA: hypothetical protein VK278_08540 [Gaiellaceae bacterium]|nr:hypothetical protein [Gaiellaceae bacterium]